MTGLEKPITEMQPPIPEYSEVDVVTTDIYVSVSKGVGYVVANHEHSQGV